MEVVIVTFIPDEGEHSLHVFTSYDVAYKQVAFWIQIDMIDEWDVPNCDQTFIDAARAINDSVAAGKYQDAIDSWNVMQDHRHYPSTPGRFEFQTSTLKDVAPQPKIYPASRFIDDSDSEEECDTCAECADPVSSCPKKVIEFDCQICGRKNDQGVKVCWGCGNYPGPGF
jgi:ferredoxin